MSKVISYTCDYFPGTLERRGPECGEPARLILGKMAGVNINIVLRERQSRNSGGGIHLCKKHLLQLLEQEIKEE